MKTDNVILQKIPAVCRITLSRDCEIIDLSDELKSCPDISVDRTVLFDSMSKSDARMLAKTCGSILPYHEPMFLKVHLSSYRYGYARHSGKPSGETDLFLCQSYRDLVSAIGNSTDKPRGDTPIPPDLLTELFSKSKVMDSADAATLLRLICSRLSKNGEIISSQIIFNESDPTAHDKDGGGCIPSGPLALVTASLLTLLDSASCDGKLNVDVSRFAGCFEVRMKTRCETTDQTYGDSPDILLLSEQLKGALPRLSLAALAAAESEMHLTGSVSLSGEVSFIFGYISETFPTLEFKFDDPSVSSNILTDAAVRLLSLPELTS